MRRRTLPTARLVAVMCMMVLAATSSLARRAEEEEVEDVLHPPGSPVTRLTAENFRSVVVESGKAAIVEFYSLRDSMSVNLAPIFEVLAHDYGQLMTVGVVNMDHEKELTQFFSYKENTAPFIMLFPPEREAEGEGRETGPFAGKSWTYYQGETNAPAVADFALSVLHDRYVTRITEENRQAFHDEAGMAKTFWFSNTNTKPPVIVQAISQAFQGRMKIGYVRRNHTDVFDFYGMPHGEVRLLTIAKNWQMHHYGGRPTASRIFKFLEKHALPRPGATPTASPRVPVNPRRTSKRDQRDEL